jgi:HEAT repeat protein
MDRIVGQRGAGALKTAAAYVADLSNPAKRVEALDALMVLRDPAAAPTLVRLLYGDEQPMPLEVRGRIVMAIYHCLDERAAFAALLPVVRREAKVKWIHAADGIGWKSISSLIAHLAGVSGYREAIPSLLVGFRKGVGRFNRPAYLRAFGRLRAREAVGDCIRQLRYHSDVSNVAAWALGRIGDGSAVPHLVRAARRRLRVRHQAILIAEAARALGALRARDAESLALLVELLGHGDEEVRGAAAEALGAVGTAQHAAALKAAAAAEQFPWVRQRMLAAAQKNGSGGR